MKTPKLSVIIPAYNASRTIEKCLLSLREQTFRDFEVLVVDDHSADNTGSIALPWAQVVRADRNLGVGGARNLGARKAQGEILVFTDADVVLPKDWLQNIVRDMETHRVVSVGGGYSGTLGNSFIENFAYLELAYRRRNTPDFVHTLVANNFACTRQVFFEQGGFPEEFKCEDLRLSFKISRKNRIYWDKQNGVYHHFRPSLAGYLKQQYEFSKDTVWSYYTLPEMLFIKTHQGRQIYVDVLLTLLILLSLPFSWGFSLLFAGTLFLTNFHFLTYLRSEGHPAQAECQKQEAFGRQEGLAMLRSLLVIFLRSFVCVLGLLAGVALCIKDWVSKSSKLNPEQKHP